MSKRLPKKVKISLQKARDSALLAVEMYNKPGVKFKTGGYVVMMVIAWTSLFHAIFFRRKIKPFYKEDNGHFYKKREGDYLYWELMECLNQYYCDDTQNPVRLNLEFFCKLRNKIEHKSLPKIDPDIFAECQAMLLNFDELIKHEFGEKYCLKELLSFSLQLSPSSESITKASTNTEESKVIDFINSYRSAMTTEIINSGKFAFKAFLIQVANHNSKDALPIQFYRYDKLSDDEKKNVDRVAALVKTKLEKVPVRNPDLMLPKNVVQAVQTKLGNPKVLSGGREVDLFNPQTHTRCWKKYKVRPISAEDDQTKTKSEYCVYDSTFDQHMYTEKWVDFLVEKMSDETEYQSLYKNPREIVRKAKTKDAEAELLAKEVSRKLAEKAGENKN